ncbi:hypothetical protein PPYR_12020 [Photinus pyralis]|uniref:LRRCT domain-containing protein n=1 Tax=Photinus pyralis TaxID=7054 RepID=A0A5N4ACZ7_PHOPY|nr:chondroadherin-like [Photinus pyralis]KAB0795181.1 hypothetical protein PPYR_12020 [Photinus pyralis]
MEAWISLLIVIIVFHPSKNVQNNYGCSYEVLLTNDRQIVCANITSSFFQYFNINVNRYHWLTCKSCNLSTISTETFHFPKNAITYLFLIDNQIISISNYSFSKLPHLKVLNLRNNLIRTIATHTFSGIGKLLQLDLSRNLLERLDADTFRDLENLDILNLNQNRISFVHQEAFASLKRLKYLYINRNYISSLSDNMFENLVDLKILYLENNDITEISRLAFNGLDNLNYLYLNNNTIITLSQYNFKPLRNLIDLQLRFNNLTIIDTSVFNGLRNLKFLYLGNNRLESINWYGLIGLDSLEVIDLIENKFQYFSLGHLKNMKNLTVLWLENNNISNFTIHSDTDVQNSLKVINLVKNELDYIDYRLLFKKVPQLEEVWLGRNNWTCEFIIEMHDFFVSSNISVCTVANCTGEAFKRYIDSICFEPYANETELSYDFATDCTNSSSVSYFILFVVLLKCYVSSTSF